MDIHLMKNCSHYEISAAKHCERLCYIGHVLDCHTAATEQTSWFIYRTKYIALCLSAGVLI